MQEINLANNARLTLGTVTMADAGPVDAEGAELIHAVSRFEENGTSAVVTVRLEGTASRAAQHKEGLCSKSSFDAELKRHIDVRRVRANDPALRKIDWSDQGLANSQVNAKHGGHALEKNLVEALKNNTYVTCVDIHNNSKITHTTTNELRVRPLIPCLRRAPPSAFNAKLHVADRASWANRS